MIQNCNVKWTFQNVRYGENDSIVKDSTPFQVPYGYYTFTSLKKYLSTQGITINALANGKVTLTSTKDLNLKTFGNLLGFVTDKAITKNTEYESVHPVNLLRKLESMSVYCDLVNEFRNIVDGERSNLLCQIFVDTQQSLFGSITR